MDVNLDDLNVDFSICFAIFTALSRMKIVCKGIFSVLASSVRLCTLVRSESD